MAPRSPQVKTRKETRTSKTPRHDNLKINDQVKTPIEIPGRLDYKRRLQIQISGQKQEPQIKTQSVARSPKNSVGRELADTLNLSANERPQNASFRKLGLLESSKSNLRQQPALLLAAGRTSRFAGPRPHCGGSMIFHFEKHNSLRFTREIAVGYD